jgi:hypothetical protein
VRIGREGREKLGHDESITVRADPRQPVGASRLT